ncbi:hypothetical protein GQ54DRAFT_264122, partial [Martensiomyces pterosporus]
VSPNCDPGAPCPAIAQVVTACPWDCSKAPPAKCTRRCKPCKKSPCLAICQCEIVCP